MPRRTLRTACPGKPRSAGQLNVRRRLASGMPPTTSSIHAEIARRASNWAHDYVSRTLQEGVIPDARRPLCLSLDMDDGRAELAPLCLPCDPQHFGLLDLRMNVRLPVHRRHAWYKSQAAALDDGLTSVRLLDLHPSSGRHQGGRITPRARCDEPPRSIHFSDVSCSSNTPLGHGGSREELFRRSRYRALDARRGQEPRLEDAVPVTVHADRVPPRVTGIPQSSATPALLSRRRITGKQKPQVRSAQASALCSPCSPNAWTARLMVQRTGPIWKCDVCQALTRGRCKGCSSGLCLACAKAGRACLESIGPPAG